MLNLATGFADTGMICDLLASGTEWRSVESTGRKTGVHRVRVVNLFPLALTRRLPKYGMLFKISLVILMLLSLPRLILYLRSHRPDILLIGLAPTAAIVGLLLAHVDTRAVVSVQGLPRSSRARRLLWGVLMKRVTAVVSPAQGVSDRFKEITNAVDSRNFVVPNPVLDRSIFELSSVKIEHPWFREGHAPIILGVGRMSRQKDFPTLLRAFAKVRRYREAHLLILGDGEDRDSLTALAQELGLGDDFDMPGYAKNPFKYMSAADVFVLSSLWEGPGHVLIEALALGAPIVSTDCPSGPREILDGGRFGKLVPVGNSDGMADAILATLSEQDGPKRVTESPRSSVRQYFTEEIVEKYSTIFRSLYSE